MNDSKANNNMRSRECVTTATCYPSWSEQSNPQRSCELLVAHGYSVLDEAAHPGISGICIRGEVAECYMAWMDEDPVVVSKDLAVYSKAFYDPCGTDTKVSRVNNGAWLDGKYTDFFMVEG